MKKPGRRRKYPLIVHVVGKLSELMTGKVPLDKYDDLGNPTFTMHIGYTKIPNVLVDLGKK